MVIKLSTTITTTKTSSTQPRILRPIIARSQSIIRTWAPWEIFPTWITTEDNPITHRFKVEIIRLLVEDENLQLIVMPTPSISLINPMPEVSFPTEEDPSQVDKQRTMRTKLTWTTPALALDPTQLLLVFTIPQSRALPITIMLWTKLSLASCRTSRIIDLRNSKTSNKLHRLKTTEYSRTTSCCPKRVPTQECWRLFIIANNLPQTVHSNRLAMCIRITTAQKEQFKAWKCTYEAKTNNKNKSVWQRSDTVNPL